MSEVAKVARIPECDVCRHDHGRERPAAYDGKMKGRPSWANMCEEHWKKFGIGKLGTGYGQRLELVDDPGGES